MEKVRREYMLDREVVERLEAISERLGYTLSGYVQRAIEEIMRADIQYDPRAAGLFAGGKPREQEQQDEQVESE